MTHSEADPSHPIGRIIVLNGAPRSGKSTLAKAIQTGLPGNWINLGVDAVMSTLPPALMPGIGLRPGGERPDLEPHVSALYGALFQSLATYANDGFDVVADLGLHEDYSRPLDILAKAARTLGPLGAFLVGIDCDLDEIMKRRNADPKNGYYAAGASVPPPVQRWQNAIHAGKDYDLRLDMGRLSPEEGREEIAKLLSEPRAAPVLARLAALPNSFVSSI